MKATVIVTLGDGNELVIDKSSNLWIRRTLRGETLCEIDLGPATFHNINGIKQCLDKLVCFTIPLSQKA